MKYVPSNLVPICVVLCYECSEATFIFWQRYCLSSEALRTPVSVGQCE
jgi:hypothetical protein